MATLTQGFLNDTVNGLKINTSYQCNSGNYDKTNSRVANYIIFHYTGNQKDAAINNCKYFQSAGRNASAHFFVDDNSIYQSVALKNVAWSIGCSQGYKTAARNSNTVNIEMCCTAGNYTIGLAALINAVYLGAHLCKMMGISAEQVDTYVLRHYDCVKSNKKCPAQMVNTPQDWVNFKTCIKNVLLTGNWLGQTAATTTNTTYRVRKTWADAKTQKGAFSNLDNAKKCADQNPGYSVFDGNGNIVYTSGGTTTTVSQPTVTPTPSPTPQPAVQTKANTYYQVKAGGKNYSEIKNYNTTNGNGYAGVDGVGITDVAMRVDKGSIKYRVHTLGGKWLGWVTGYNWWDVKNGYAGNGKVIDAIQIVATGCGGRAKYRVSSTANGSNYYGWVYDASDYAGVFGKPIDKIQFVIE